MLLSLSLLAVAPAQSPFGELRPMTSTLPTVDGTAVGDFDGDGQIELAAISRLAGTVAIFGGASSFEFRQRKIVARDVPLPIGIAAAELTGDGNVDLVVVSANANEGVLLLEGNGDGTFQAPRSIGSGGRHGARVALEDVDGDGDLDVVVPTGGAFGALPAVFQNLGGGAFLGPDPISNEWGNDVASIDADGDGDLDMLVANQFGGISVFRNDGGMVFVGGAQALVPNTFVTQVVTADLDGDGDLDVLAALEAAGTGMLAFENQGAFVFGAPLGIGPAASGPAELVALDYDFDGVLDILEISRGPGTSGWVRNLGGFSFASASPILQGAAGVRSVEVVEINSDGLVDLVFARRDDSIVALSSFIDPMGATFFLPQEISERFVDARDIVAIDIEGDGDLDVVAASATEGLVLSRNFGFTSFVQPQRIVPLIDGAFRLAASDVDGDGDTDLLVLDSQRRLLLLSNNGGAGQLSPQTIDAGGAGGQLDGAIQVGDIDLDGDLDVVVLALSGEVVAYEQLSPGAFGPRQVVASGPEIEREILLTDIDQDGALDLAVLGERASGQVPRPRRIRGFMGTGAGAFVDAGLLIGDIGDATTLRALDLNGVGAPEFLWASPGGSFVDGAVSIAVGAYQALPSVLDVTLRPTQIESGVIGPGPTRDVLTCSRSIAATTPDRLQFFNGAGAGFFAPPVDVTDEVYGCVAMRLVDMDADGDLDILVASTGDDQIAWIPNERNGSVGTPYCGPAVPNSFGSSAELMGIGSDSLLANNLELRARLIPIGATTLFVVGTQQGFTPMAGGGVGTLCIGGSVGRFMGPGQVGPASMESVATLDVDWTAIPQPTSTVSAAFGSTWFFQAWYRDTSAAGPTSNFTNGLAVVVR